MMGSNKLSHTNTNPFKKFPFTFTHTGAARSMAEYQEVREALRAAIKLPQADAEARQEIIHLLDSPDFKPDRSPFICYLTQDQWTFVSRALRGWHYNDGYAPHAYSLMVQAKNRPLTKRRKK